MVRGVCTPLSFRHFSRRKYTHPPLASLADETRLTLTDKTQKTPEKVPYIQAFPAGNWVVGAAASVVSVPLSRRRARLHRAARSMLWVTSPEVSPWLACKRL